jgi:DNA-binding NtrC family response regulator
VKILVVDDEPSVKETFGRLIGKMGHMPFIANNGAKAIELYKLHRPDMVLLDVNLLGMQGDKVFKEIIEFDKNAAIYFITGYREEYIKALDLKPAGFFHKPITIEQVMKIIEERKNIIDAAKPKQ